MHPLPKTILFEINFPLSQVFPFKTLSLTRISYSEALKIQVNPSASTVHKKMLHPVFTCGVMRK